MTTSHHGAALTFLDKAREHFLTEPNRATFRVIGDDDPTQPLGFVVDALADGGLDARARALAVHLRRHVRVGDRALILCEPGLGYLTAFFACLYAGIVAVPSYPPAGATAHRLQRVALVARDCRAAVILTDRALAADVATAPELAGTPAVCVDDLDLADAGAWRRPPIIGADTAFLQYSSGSTGDPKGVIVTHANLLAQSDMLSRRFLPGADAEWDTLTWLPPYHDMGLIGALLTFAVTRSTVAVMPPMAFLKRPLRWLQVASRIGARLTGAPNFAFDLCVRKATPEVVATLDLSALEVMFSGAEPVRADTLARFADTFGPAGFEARSYLPCYGLAEATLAVTATLRTSPARVLSVSASGINEATVRPATSAEDERRVVSCGPVVDGHRLRIIDPGTGDVLPAQSIGEIQVSGPSVTDGYFGRPDLTRATYVADPGAPDTVWLRTGDLGFLDSEELVVVGRIKDLVIVNGRNHHPHDLEDAVAPAHPGIRPGGVAAFVWGEGEAVALLIEVDGHTSDADAEQIDRVVRAALAADHGVSPGAVVLVKPGTILKTSSGKVQRRASCDALARGLLDDRIRWTFGDAPRRRVGQGVH